MCMWYDKKPIVNSLLFLPYLIWAILSKKRSRVGDSEKHKKGWVAIERMLPIEQKIQTSSAHIGKEIAFAILLYYKWENSS